MRKNSVLKFCFFLGFWLKKLCLMAEETQPSCQNFFLWVHRINFLVLKTWKCTICSFLVLTAKKNLRILFGRIVKSLLVLSRVIVWGKLVLWRFVFFLLSGKLKKTFCLSSKGTKPSCQKIVLPVQRLFFPVRKL